MSVLYIVSTPIGNLDDVTRRAIVTLKAVDRVLAEDTRRTAVLFRHYDITTPLVSAHAHNEAARVERLLGWLDDGQCVALVSDAGTPLLSDPGARLVRAVIDAGHDVVPIPGPSALLAALVASGLEPEPFSFFGFPPRAGKERAALLQAIVAAPHTTILYEAPGRLRALLRDLADAGAAERQVVVARELTKVHESFVRGTPAAVGRHYEEHPPRGEVVVLIEGAPAAIADPAAAAAVGRELLATGGSPSEVARELARRLHIPRNQAYAIVLSLAAESNEGDT